MCSPANDPTVWDILIHLLRDRGPGTDSVVRLTAATALRECIDVRFFLHDHDPMFTLYIDCQFRHRCLRTLLVYCGY
jgi:hypothetical protein